MTPLAKRLLEASPFYKEEAEAATGEQHRLKALRRRSIAIKADADAELTAGECYMRMGVSNGRQFQVYLQQRCRRPIR